MNYFEPNILYAPNLRQLQESYNYKLEPWKTIITDSDYNIICYLSEYID